MPGDLDHRSLTYALLDELGALGLGIGQIDDHIRQPRLVELPPRHLTRRTVIKRVDGKIAVDFPPFVLEFLDGLV